MQQSSHHQFVLCGPETSCRSMYPVVLDFYHPECDLVLAMLMSTKMRDRVDTHWTVLVYMSFILSLNVALTEMIMAKVIRCGARSKIKNEATQSCCSACCACMSKCIMIVCCIVSIPMAIGGAGYRMANSPTRSTIHSQQRSRWLRLC